MNKYSKIKSLLLILVLVGLHGMVAEHVVEAWHSLKEYGIGAHPDWSLIIVILVSSAFFAGATVRLWRFRSLVLHSSAKVVISDSAGPADGALILLLSPPLPHGQTAFAKVVAHAVLQFNEIDRTNADPSNWLSKLAIATKVYNFDDANPYTMWKWQQQLRIVESEMQRATAEKPLNQIIIVCTQDSKDHDGVIVPGSIHNFVQIKSVLEALFKGWPKGGMPDISMIEDGLLIGSYNASYAVCKQAIDKAKQNPKNKDRKICFDISGGITESSAAAAIATLNSDVRFSYVNTNDAKPQFGHLQKPLAKIALI